MQNEAFGLKHSFKKKKYTCVIPKKKAHYERLKHLTGFFIMIVL